MSDLFIAAMSLVGVVVACISLLLGLYACIEVKAMQRSTHQIQYIDPSQEVDDNFFTDEAGFQELDDKTREKLEEEGDLFGDETKFDKIKY